MGNKIDRIEHEGVVEEVFPDKLIVNILQQSSCASCAVKGACNAAESTNKEVEISDFSGQFQQGEYVNVYFERTLGFKALFLAYVIPLLLLVTILILGTVIFEDEAIAGIVSLISLLPYYSILYLTRNKIKKEFSFRVEKKQANAFHKKSVNSLSS